MQAVLPGKPQSTFQAFDTVDWNDQRIIAYISRNALIILAGPRDLIQTITFDDSHVLCAVAIDKTTGKIAVSTNCAVFIYRPYGHEYGANVQWSLLFEHFPSNQEDSITCLSWGLPNEILIGGSSLVLLSTSEPEGRETWTRQLANPAKHAQFSHDAGLIASTGQHDRLAKIWRRLFSGDNNRFDAAYLLHPAAVTALWWRARPNNETHTPSVLYTLCADNNLRVWTDVSPHCVHILELWHQLDLLSCMPNPTSENSQEPQRRYVFTIDSWDFKTMLDDAAVSGKDEGEREQHHREHLREMTAREPEVCIILNDSGIMSAWGLERVGHKARHLNDVLNIAYTEDAHWSPNLPPPGQNDFARLLGFVSPRRDGKLQLVAHSHHAGRLDWLNCRIDRLLDPARQSSSRITFSATSTGPPASVKRMIAGPKNSDCFLLLTSENEAYIWECSSRGAELSMCQRSQLDAGLTSQDGIYLDNGNTVALLHHSTISIWHVASNPAVKLCEASFKAGNAAKLYVQATKSDGVVSAIVAAVTDSLVVQAWIYTNEASEAVLVSVSSSLTPLSQPSTTVKSFLDPSILMAADKTNRSLQSWELVVKAGQAASVELRKTKSISLWGQNEFRFIAPAGHHLVAITHEATNAVAIWNLDSECLEYQASFPDHDPIKWLTWGAATDKVAVLAIIFAHQVHVLCQARVNHRTYQPPWVQVQVINLKNDTPHEADAAIWHPLSNGTCHLIVETIARQIFDYAGGFSLNSVSETGKSKPIAYDLVQVAAQLNAGLPIYHPTLLKELIAIGQVNGAYEILASLDKCLKFFTTDETLESDIGLDQNSFTTIKATTRTNGHALNDEDEDKSRFSESTAESLTASLDNMILPHISKAIQAQLKHVIKSLGDNSNRQTSIDGLGLQFLAEFDSQRLETGSAVASVTWREIVWAQHSSSQEILLDLTTRHLDNKLLWDHAKATGMFMWATDIEALKARFETVARSEYAKTEERNPVDCALHYIALGKKTALAGLWRLATWNREKTATMKLLANNFDDPRWKSAALKNAYALLGRHRTQYAAAFFLLAGNLKDCVSILANQLNDLQLAIAVARVYEGTESAGPVLTDLIKTHVLTLAARTGDVWLAVWGFEMLGQHDMALRVLTQPLVDVIVVDSSQLEPRSYRTDDPSLHYMYTWIRDKYPQAAWGISAKAEKDLALRAAKTYACMGCDVLSLSVLRGFVFSANVPGATRPTSSAALAGADLNGQLESMRLAHDNLKETKVAPAATTVEVPNMLAEFDAGPPPSANGTQVIKAQETSTKPAAALAGRKVVQEAPPTSSILDDFDF